MSHKNMFPNFNKEFFVQKRLTIFVLPFLVLLSLFLSPVSFALSSFEQRQVQSQLMIIKRLGTGTSSCSLAKKDIEELQDSEGLCFGFSVLWSYSKWQQSVHPEKGDWYQSTVTDILGDWSDCANIKKFFSLVNKIQALQHGWARVFEKEINQLDTNENKIRREYSIASLFTLNQLKQLLKGNIIHNHKIFIISARKHATALFKDGNKYYYFDPNSKFGEVQCGTIDELVSQVFSSFSSNSKETLTLGLEVFSFDGEKQNYPSQQEILSCISPSLFLERYFTNEYTGLHMAAAIGCLESARYFLNEGIDVNKLDNDGFSALMLAARNGHYEVVQLLLKKGADINKIDNDGVTALTHAVVTDHHDIVQLLLEEGADVNKTNNSDNTALTIAILKGRYKIVRLLLEKGADVNRADNNGLTPLMIAILNGHYKIVQLLLEKGADVNRTDNNGLTPLEIAIVNDHNDIAQLLSYFLRKSSSE